VYCKKTEYYQNTIYYLPKFFNYKAVKNSSHLPAAASPSKPVWQEAVHHFQTSSQHI